MKKIVGTVVIVTGALLSGGYYGMGVLTERALQHSIESFNQNRGMHLQMKNYHRGWLKSNAKLQVVLQMPDHATLDANGQPNVAVMQKGERYTLLVPLEIFHGPIAYSHGKMHFGLGYASTTLNMPDVLNAQLKESIKSDGSTLPLVHLNALVTYGNTTYFQFDLPAFKLLFKTGEDKLDWQGMHADLQVTSGIREVKGDALLDGVSIVKGDVTANATKLQNKFDLKRNTEGLYLGSAMIQLPHVQMKEKEETLLELNALKIKTNSSMEKRLLDSSLTIELQSVTVNQRTYGPALLQVVMNHLDGVALAEVNKKINQLQQGTDNERQQTFLLILPHLPKLLAEGPIFEITTLNLKLPEGQVEGNLNITLPKHEATNNVMDLIKKIQGKGHLQLPIALARDFLVDSIQQKLINQSTIQQAAQPADQKDIQPLTSDDAHEKAAQEANEQLASMVKASLVVEKSDNYTLDFVLSDGKITLNGKPFNLQSLLRF